MNPIGADGASALLFQDDQMEAECVKLVSIDSGRFGAFQSFPLLDVENFIPETKCFFDLLIAFSQFYDELFRLKETTGRLGNSGYGLFEIQRVPLLFFFPDLNIGKNRNAPKV
jgi:hypothetical protein